MCQFRSVFQILLACTISVAFLVNNTQASEADGWKFDIAFPLIWISDIEGNIDVSDNSYTISKSFDETLESLSFGYMVEFYARLGRWQYALKLNYAESDESSITDEFVLPPGIPIAPSHKIATDTVEGTTDVTFGYRLDSGILLYSGVRTVFSKIDLSITPLGTGIIEVEEHLNIADENLSDLLVGAEYRHQFSPRLGFMANADFGVAGDNDTDFSASMMLNYRFSPLNSISLGYRYLRIADEFTQDGLRIKTDFITQGPTIGWLFSF